MFSQVKPRPLVDLYTAPAWDQGISELIQPWHDAPAKPFMDFWANACDYDLAVFSTAPFDRFHPAFDEDAARKGLACPKGGKPPRMATFVHNTDLFASDKAQKQLAWLKIDAFLGVAPHTAEALRNAGARNVDYVPSVYPLFPEGWNSTSRKGLGIPGQLDTTRRNYASVFRELETAPPPSDSPALPVHLLGSFGPEATNASIPPALLTDGLVTLPGAGRRVLYSEFYSYFPRARALLPALRTDAGYTSVKASSAVFSSLVSLTPLAVPAELLETYSFLDPAAHFSAADLTVKAAHEAMQGRDYAATLRRLHESRVCMMGRNARVFAALLAGEPMGLPEACGRGAKTAWD